MAQNLPKSTTFWWLPVIWPYGLRRALLESRVLDHAGVGRGGELVGILLLPRS